MKRKNSLKRNEEIAKIVQYRHKFKNSRYIIFCKENNLGKSRICISVSKKLGIAVIRNRIKRQVREMITDIFDFNLSMDYVIVIKDTFLNNDFNNNKDRLKELYLKINPSKEIKIDE